MRDKKRGNSVIEEQSKSSRTNEMANLSFSDQNDSSSLIEIYRGELLLHCYRLLGSLHDAEDAVQETILRAWRHFHTFSSKGPGSLRNWLYTIATNVCLDALKKRSPRTLPLAAFPVSDPARPVAPRGNEALWLEPFPDSWLAEVAENPEARYTRYESVSLAFLTALQLLPPRQRAILLLSDVLDWRAVEIARLLEISVGAVNSALHRARVTLEKHYHSEERAQGLADHTDATVKSLLARYMRAWETDDVDGLVALLKEDATLSMPPVPSWYQGREAIYAIFRSVLFPPEARERWRLLPTRANGQPAFAVYRADETDNSYRAFALQIVTLTDSRDEIADVTAFLGGDLAVRFGFPPRLPQ